MQLPQSLTRKQTEFRINQCGIECFLPLLEESKIIRRTRNTVTNPLFPDFLFAQFEVERHYRAVSMPQGFVKSWMARGQLSWARPQSTLLRKG